MQVTSSDAVREHFNFTDDVATYNDTELDECLRLLKNDIGHVMDSNLYSSIHDSVRTMIRCVETEIANRSDCLPVG